MGKEGQTVVLCGASVRAAAFSALRAGMRPWCIDLFGDLDLQASVPCQVIPGAAYPHGLLEYVRHAPDGPLVYTGALENHPDLVERLTFSRQLWGNPAEVLRSVRSPERVHAALTAAGVACPAVALQGADTQSTTGWLTKPLRGAGGSGIRRWAPGERLAPHHYLQQFVPGTSIAALYVGNGQQAALVGVTEQLVGASWLHAAPFHYCGSVGPLPLREALLVRLSHLGAVLGRTFSLRGLFGVDCQVKDEVPYPVEINPRYTASVEVLEHATGLRALELHRAALGSLSENAVPGCSSNSGWVGKAIYFAPHDLVVPQAGPWQHALDNPWSPEILPRFGDIPAAGTRIPRGRPVLTCFARAATRHACLADLRAAATELDRLLR